MFGMLDNDDPTPADEGNFIPDADLQKWWKSMQQKHPDI
jgi:hypothetical protein